MINVDPLIRQLLAARYYTRTTQIETALMLYKGVDVPDIESVQKTVFSSLVISDDQIKYYTGLLSSAVFNQTFYRAQCSVSC